MNQRTTTLFLAIAAGIVSMWTGPLEAAERPNIVLLVADNLGYGDTGCYGNKEIKTPRLDRLATEGVRCTDFYAASPTCTVSRAAFLTGRYPQRNGLTRQLGMEENRTGVGLRHSELLLPHFLRGQGYRTACFGKWNIGFAKGSRPTERGFDEFLGHRSGNIDYYTHVYNLVHDMYKGTEPFRSKAYSTDLFADTACEFIDRNAKRPFFLYVPFNSPHYPNPGSKKPGVRCEWQAPDAAFKLYGYSPDTQDEKQRYQAVVSALDTAIGRVLDRLDSAGLREKTLLIFYSDNGAFMRKGCGLGCASNAPLRTEALKLYDGNIRVPCMVRWPGRIEPGTTCREPLITMDMFAMALAAAGAPLPKDRTIDGRDPTATLTGKAPSPHEALFFRFYGRPRAVRAGNYKLLKTSKKQPWQLFDVVADIGETTDLAAKKPELVAKMSKQFDNWLAEVEK